MTSLFLEKIKISDLQALYNESFHNAGSVYWPHLSYLCHFSPRAREGAQESLWSQLVVTPELDGIWRDYPVWTFITSDSVWAQAPWGDSDPNCWAAGLAPSTHLFLNVSIAFAIIIVTKPSFKLSWSGHGCSWRDCRLPHPLDWRAA